jgi:hypothetical protein
MARLTKDQWAEARAWWESDPAVSFQMVADRYKCSRPAVGQKAEKEGWTRGEESTADSSAPAPKEAPAPKLSPTPKLSAPKAPKAPAQESAPGEGETPASTTALSQRDRELMFGRRPVGRPTEYRPEFVAELIAYFDIEVERLEDVDVVSKDGQTRTEKKVVINTFPTLTRFASRIGVTRQTLHDWATATDKDGALLRPEFSYAYARAKDSQESLLIEGGMAGVYEPRFATLAVKNLAGWQDKLETMGEVTHTMAKVEELDDFYAQGAAQMEAGRLKVLERKRRAAGAQTVDVREVDDGS